MYIYIIIIRFRQFQVKYRSSVAYRDNYPLYIKILFNDVLYIYIYIYIILYLTYLNIYVNDYSRYSSGYIT